MYTMTLKAPADKSLLAEVHSSISVDTPELMQQGMQTKRVFVPAVGNISIEMEAGDEILVGEFTPDYTSLEDLVAGEDNARQAATQVERLAEVGEAVMPEVAEQFAGDWSGDDS